ncbi:ABC transporter permease [Luteibacter flocculans]|uniref:ABC transporter permease n=1 Tax=Luteibacter flocculans TaxID=2780091 RepID=A0ABY4SZ45_9GAMM|nr:ABC transporter permease [Luteibacter flocculans]URL56977.1 ABC transporter permease [Luteibacter flocculans]
MAEWQVLPVVRRWLIASEWRAYPGRFFTAVLAIALGVALGFAVHLVNASALGEFDKAMHAANGSADLTVRSANAFGFDENLYPRIARLPGMRVSPVVALAGVAEGKTPVSIDGVDIFRWLGAAPVQDADNGAGADAFGDFLVGRAVRVSSAVLSATGRRVGDRLRLDANGHTWSVRIAGEIPSTDGRASVLVDIAAAQWRFGSLGRLHRLDIHLLPGTNAAEARRSIEALLPADAMVADAASDRSRNEGLSAAYRVNLDMLALIALLTGGFLVYSAQSLSVARRHAQFALLRVLGMERRKVLAQVLTEALVLGSLGAAAGIGLGIALAALALKLLGGDLGGGYFMGDAPTLVFAPWAAASFAALGVAAAVLGSIVPASAAARLAPGVAIKQAGDMGDPRRRQRSWPALALLGAALLVSFLPAVGGIAVFGYVAMALLLAGGVMLMPSLARALVAPLRLAPFRNLPFRLATERLWGAPSQASVALSGIVASTALTVAMAIMVTSFRGSVDHWLDDVLRADIYVSAENGPTGGFDADAQARMRRVPGVASFDVLKETPLQFDKQHPPVVLRARVMAGTEKHLALMDRQAAVPEGQIPVWVSEPASRIYGWRPGQRLTLPLPGAPLVTVAGIWRDYARQHGAIVIDDAAYTRLTGDGARTGVAVVLAPGAQATDVISRLRAAAGPAYASATVSRPQDIRRQALKTFDRSFLITYLLEAIAIAVGLAGVAATIGAQVLSRIREFGMLRHVGATRRELALMLVTEGALLGLVGGIAGVALGAAMSQVLIHVVNPQSFHWTMDTMLPWTLLCSAVAGLVVATSGTALIVGRSAFSANAVQAVREDW